MSKSITELINERRRENTSKTSSNERTGRKISTDQVAVGGKIMSMAQVEKSAGKDANKNMSGGRWGIDEPATDKNIDLSNTEQFSKNKKMLLAKFRAEEDFFIEGEAGWAKTTLIKKMASTFNRTVVTVYLDKILATDLGGIPIPTRSQKGAAMQEYAMPGWAAYMYEHPEKEFLLFFDEMNQAAPDVMNALMPIVLEHEVCGEKFDNFFVGAAGNLREENRGVNELSGPLKSRFKPIIHWETKTENAWNDAFDYLHKEYDKTLGKEFVDKFYEDKDLFDNPREVEHKIFQFVNKILHTSLPGDNKGFDAAFFNERLDDLVSEDEQTRTQKDKIAKLAEYIADYVQSGGLAAKSKEKAKSKSREMVPKNVQDLVLGAMKDGFVVLRDGDKPIEKYAFCPENISSAFEEDIINREQLDRLIKKFEAEGIKWYYKSIADIKKDPDYKAGKLLIFEE